MNVGFGLVSCQLAPGDAPSWANLYSQAIEIAETADRVGLASLWTTEHHFVDDGYMPSLLVTMAAMAARTQNIRLGSGVLLAPLHHPLRLAEDAATVDLISSGRLIMGLGLGWSEVEFEALGVPKDQRGRAMSEMISILRQAWSGQPIAHDGEVYRTPPVGVRPTPDSPIPIWVGGNAEPALRRIGRLADGFFGNASPRRLAEQVEIIQEERAAHSVERPFEWGYYHYLWITDDEATDRPIIEDLVWQTMWKYSDMEASAGRRLDRIPQAPPPTVEQAERVRRTVAIGTAEQVAERLTGVFEAVAVPLHFVARSYFPGMDHSRQLEQVERLASELAPLLP